MRRPTIWAAWLRLAVGRCALGSPLPRDPAVGHAHPLVARRVGPGVGDALDCDAHRLLLPRQALFDVEQLRVPAFPAINIFDKFRLGLNILVASQVKDGRSMEQIPVEDWLREMVGQAHLRAHVVAAAAFETGRKTTRRCRRPSSGQPSRACTRPRRTGMKQEMFGYLPGGYARVFDALQAALEAGGVSILTGHRAELVRKTADGVSIEFADGKEVQADEGGVTVPSHWRPASAPTCPRRKGQTSSAGLPGHRLRVGVVGQAARRLLRDQPARSGPALYRRHRDDGDGRPGAVRRPHARLLAALLARR